MTHRDMTLVIVFSLKTILRRHYNKIYSIKLDQDYQMILPDKTSFPIASLNMNDRHVKVQDPLIKVNLGDYNKTIPIFTRANMLEEFQNNIVSLLHVYKHYFSYDYD